MMLFLRKDTYAALGDCTLFNLRMNSMDTYSPSMQQCECEGEWFVLDRENITLNRVALGKLTGDGQVSNYLIANR